jgi:hypothetical protein
MSSGKYGMGDFFWFLTVLMEHHPHPSCVGVRGREARVVGK